ncbi:MAG: MauE/DoxX family redox-associated membrane protein [Candidatus Omnitrophota bacterium]
MFVVIRLLLGALFIFSGGEKLLKPMEEFLYVIDGYQALPQWAEPAVALLFPWVEFFAGLFILLGFWLRQALAVLLLLSAALALIVGQAILRHLPLDNCGCFGELIHLPLHGVILIDLSVIALSALCLANSTKASRYSLDAFYARPKA